MLAENFPNCLTCVIDREGYNLYNLPKYFRNVFLRSLCQEHFAKLERDVQREVSHRLLFGTYPEVLPVPGSPKYSIQKSRPRKVRRSKRRGSL